jgi:hypothetical protein
MSSIAASPTVESADNPIFHRGTLSIRRVVGARSILAIRALLSDFARLSEQPDAFADLPYFLSKPGVLKRVPVLLLAIREVRDPASPLRAEDIAGTLLLYEYSFAGIASGVFTSNDRSGRNTLVSAPALRSPVLEAAIDWLLANSAHLILLSFRGAPDPCCSRSGELSDNLHQTRWAARTREIPDFLPLEPSFDATLACVGQRTRSNMRYYRRRAEKELDCTFIPDLQISTKDLLNFNRECMYRVSQSIAAWRLHALRGLDDPILMGIHDREGRWLSILGGRRIGNSSEIFWQLNRDGLQHLSLSLVLRSYFLEHEIQRGANRFYIEGGTSHPIRFSFRQTQLTDLAVLRHSLRARLAHQLARWRVNRENELAAMLLNDSVEWHSLKPCMPISHRSGQPA